MVKKNIVILGSTGTIGINTLEVVRRLNDRFHVFGLTAHSNHKLLDQQIDEFKPEMACIGEDGFGYLNQKHGNHETQILNLIEGLETIVSHPKVDIVVIGMSGGAAFIPFMSAVKAGKRVAPANKEALVIGGELLMAEARKSGAEIIPIDSEQSAIFQCLEGRKKEDVEKIYLTASGGTLLDIPEDRFDNLQVEYILDHPRWKMGDKITVDSATLMNKGFEIIEAMRLFDIPIEMIEVVVHPEAIIHSMVALKDGSVIAQLSVTDMQLPIQYALTCPERLDCGFKPLDLFEIRNLSFRKPDFDKFPSLRLCMDVAKKGKTYPAVLNAADEIAVQAYLNKKITFSDIFRIVTDTVGEHQPTVNPQFDDILSADQWARDRAEKKVELLV